LNIRIECLDSEGISTEENLVAIIDCPMTGHVRWNSFHGKDGQGHALIKDLVKSHKQDGQVKDIEIGDRLLEYEEALCPEDYVFAYDTTKSAMGIYRKACRTTHCPEGTKAENETNLIGKFELGQTETTRSEGTFPRSREEFAVATAAEADAYVGGRDSPIKDHNSDTRGDNVERDLGSNWRRGSSNSLSNSTWRGMSSK
jgi:hypothetical protein